MRSLVFTAAILALILPASAETVVLKDGRTVNTNALRRAGNNIMLTVELSGTQAGQPAKTGEIGYPVSQIANINFPEPLEIKASVLLINSGKAGAALAQIEPVLTRSEQFRDVPGAWWTDLAILKLQALNSLEQHAKVETFSEEIARIAPGSEAAGAARAYLAGTLLRKGQPEKALELLNAVLKESKRSDTLASAAFYKGLCHLARTEWADALLSLLEIPVFYPKQEVLMPRVLLASGQAYIGLGDLTRAKTALERVIAAYPATPEAALAGAEMTKIATLEKQG